MKGGGGGSSSGQSQELPPDFDHEDQVTLKYSEMKQKIQTSRMNAEETERRRGGGADDIGRGGTAAAGLSRSRAAGECCVCVL